MSNIAELIATESHSTEAEQTVLGAIVIDPDTIHDVAPLLRPQDFYDPMHRDIYTAALDLHHRRRPVDFVTLSDALKKHDRLQEIGGSAFIAGLASATPTASHALTYAKIVREKALKREMMQFGQALAERGRDETCDASDLQEFAEQRILAASRASADTKPQYLSELTDATYDRYVQLHEAEDGSPLYGVNTGFPKLDDKLAGLRAGDFVVIAARPSMGKTALALDIACNAAAEQKKNVAVFSLEMTKEQIMDRLVSGYLGIETWKLRKGKLTDEEFDALGNAMDRIAQHKIALDDDADMRLLTLRSKARRHQMEEGIDLLIVDYLQLIETTSKAAQENRTQQVTEISKSLKKLARELQVPVIALSQLSRSCESRNPPIPILADLRDSGSIEQDADMVLMLYREGYYHADCEHPNQTDVYVRKNRNGPTGIVELRFNAQQMTFEEA